MATIQISDLNIPERNKVIYIIMTGVKHIEFTCTQSKSVVISRSIEMLINGNRINYINYNLHKQYKWLIKLSVSINYGTKLVTCYIGIYEFTNIIKCFGLEIVIDKQNCTITTVNKNH